MRWVIFLGILAISNPTLAQMKAIDLEKHCRAVDRIVEGREILETDVSDAALCIGYLGGFMDTVQVMENFLETEIFCIPPEGLPSDQTRRVFMKFLEENPTELSETARSTLWLAMNRSFACR